MRLWVVDDVPGKSRPAMGWLIPRPAPGRPGAARRLVGRRRAGEQGDAAAGRRLRLEDVAVDRLDAPVQVSVPKAMLVSVTLTCVVVLPTWVRVIVPPVAKVPVGLQVVATANALSHHIPAPEGW